jgi:hypothetical protein
MNQSQLYTFITSKDFCSQMYKIAMHAIHTGRRSACDINTNGKSFEYIKMFHELEDFKTKTTEGFKNIIRIDIYPKERLLYIPPKESVEYLQDVHGKTLITGHADNQLNIDTLFIKQKSKQLLNLDALEDKLQQATDTLEIERILQEESILTRVVSYRRNGNGLEIGKTNKYMLEGF